MTNEFVAKNPISTVLLLSLASAGVVGTAWLFQLAGYLPCQLCLWQRVPYYVATPLLLIAAILVAVHIGGKQTLRLTLYAGAVLFAGSALLAAYHSGVEWSWWPGPTTCGAAGNFTPNDAGDLLNSLASTRPPSCTEAAGRFLGLSFAGWNFVASILLGAGCLTAANSLRSNRYLNEENYA